MDVEQKRLCAQNAPCCGHFHINQISLIGIISIIMIICLALENVRS